MVCDKKDIDTFIMGITIDGIIGEQLLFRLLYQLKKDYLQLDAISFGENETFAYEAKHQEIYTKEYKGKVTAPYDGHGLPPSQVAKRIKLLDKHGIRTIFIVFEKPFFETKKIWWQYLDKLERGEHFDTTGTRNGIRRIYNINNFEQVAMDESNITKVKEQIDKLLSDLTGIVRHTYKLTAKA